MSAPGGPQPPAYSLPGPAGAGWVDPRPIEPLEAPVPLSYGPPPSAGAGAGWDAPACAASAHATHRPWQARGCLPSGASTGSRSRLPMPRHAWTSPRPGEVPPWPTSLLPCRCPWLPRPQRPRRSGPWSAASPASPRTAPPCSSSRPVRAFSGVEVRMAWLEVKGARLAVLAGDTKRVLIESDSPDRLAKVGQVVSASLQIDDPGFALQPSDAGLPRPQPMQGTGRAGWYPRSVRPSRRPLLGRHPLDARSTDARSPAAGSSAGTPPHGAGAGTHVERAPTGHAERRARWVDMIRLGICGVFLVYAAVCTMAGFGSPGDLAIFRSDLPPSRRSFANGPASVVKGLPLRHPGDARDDHRGRGPRRAARQPQPALGRRRRELRLRPAHGLRPGGHRYHGRVRLPAQGAVRAGQRQRRVPRPRRAPCGCGPRRRACTS